jgi:hypothetical protein
MATFASLWSVSCFSRTLSKRDVSFRTFGSKNSVPALQHFLPVESQCLTTIVQLGGQAEEDCNSPAGDLLSTLQYSVYLLFPALRASAEEVTSAPRPPAPAALRV